MIPIILVHNLRPTLPAWTCTLRPQWLALPINQISASFWAYKLNVVCLTHLSFRRNWSKLIYPHEDRLMCCVDCWPASIAVSCNRTSQYLTTQDSLGLSHQICRWFGRPSWSRTYQLSARSQTCYEIRDGLGRNTEISKSCHSNTSEHLTVVEFHSTTTGSLIPLKHHRWTRLLP